MSEGGKRDGASVKWGADVQSQPTIPNTNEENSAKDTPVNLVEIYNAQKRSAEEAGIESSGMAAKRNTGRRGPVTRGSGNVGEEVQVPGENFSPQQVRRKRRPPRRLPVPIQKKDIWSRLLSMDSGLSIADWLAMDKAAYNDIRDGLRYLHGRQTRGRNLTQAQAQAQVQGVTMMDINHVEQDDEDNEQWSDDSWEDGEYELFGSDVGDFDEHSLGGYESDDTGIDYPYNYEAMKNSRPLRATISIHDLCIEAIFDTGASVSVISKTLADKIGLTTTNDSLQLSSLGEATGPSCKIARDVPVRIAGKLRKEHMCIIESDRDLCLIGMTWFRAHGVRVDNYDATIIIPIKQGRDSIIVQGSSEEQERETSAVFAVNVAQVDDDANKNEEARQMETKVVVPRSYQEDLDDNNEKDNEEMAEELQDLLQEYAHCFVEVSGLGCVKIGVEHEIPVRCMEPIRSRPYRLTWEEEKYLQEELTRLLDLGLISPSNGQWTSPIFFVKKKDGQLRLVVDYRKLNDRTIKDAYPLPQIDNLLDSMGGARVFSTLDAASGYWQIPLSKEASERSGFVCPFGTFTWNVMSFGLTSAPSTFQRTMNTILQRFIGKFVYCFIDDIIIYSRSMSEHQEHLRLVFEACDKANLRLKYSKCSFGQKSVEYLGHVVSDQGLSPTARNVSKILEMPPPRNVEEVRSFLGLSGYYRRFVPQYARILAPISSLLKKETKFEWGILQQKAFDGIKEIMTHPPILAFPDRTQVQILTTDASGIGVGAILSQSPDGSSERETVIAYESRVLRGPEVRYSAVHQEALAVCWAVDKFRHYLSGRSFILRTDSSAVSFVLNSTKPSKLQRWAAMLMEYEFEVKHHPGKLNPADALSRLLPVLPVNFVMVADYHEEDRVFESGPDWQGTLENDDYDINDHYLL